jgi:hypothetical protein
MLNSFTRRGFLQWSAVALPGQALALQGGRAAEQEGASMTFGESYPAYPRDVAREIVTVAHFNLGRVRELVSARPPLARAAWDWGFGDWETPLGAASHMGRRDIAEYLLTQGAVPSLFSATMLGHLATVKEILAAEPDAPRLAGPHSISLLAHARVGGKPAAEVFAYLETLGNADQAAPVALSEAELTAIAGTYVFGSEATQQIEVNTDMHVYANSPMYTHAPQLNWTRKGTMGRPLFHVGDRAFYPAGAAGVRIRFGEQAQRMVMTVEDGGEKLVATRAVG